MKKVFATIFLVLAFLVLEGCSASATEFPIPVATAPGEPLATVLSTEPPVTEVPKDTQQAPVQGSTGIISRDDAIAIALSHAGFTADQVKGLECEFDIDNRVPEYEVDFHEGKYEYNYDIHAETGEILFQEKEMDD